MDRLIKPSLSEQILIEDDANAGGVVQELCDVIKALPDVAEQDQEDGEQEGGGVEDLTSIMEEWCLGGEEEKAVTAQLTDEEIVVEVLGVEEEEEEEQDGCSSDVE